MSLTSLFVLYGMIIPSVAGPIFWREPFGIPQIAGMAIMLASLWLLRAKDDGAQPAGRRWGIMAGLCFLLSGMAGLIEKVHQSTDGREERRMFLFCAFTLMLLFSLAGTLTLRKSAAKSAPSNPLCCSVQHPARSPASIRRSISPLQASLTASSIFL